ncbi:MAG: transglycosylase domain-containing protein [Rhodobacteraceae bacterium]|nr:transglycosylase domain-containing protein [Paracoccaceae bacterium]
MTQASAGDGAVSRKVPGRVRATGKKPGAGKRKRRRRAGWWYRAASFLLRISWYVGWRSALLLTLILSVPTTYYYLTLPEPRQLLESRTAGSAVLLDRNGDSFAWRGVQYGGPISSLEVAPVLRHAVIATEDQRFHSHFGVSPRGIMRAIVTNLSEGRGPFRGHGGSTITQQVGKLLCLGKEYDAASGLSEAQFERDCRRTTLGRKISEVPFAFALELKFSKEEILTIYLNRVYLGAGATGFEAASQRYFDTSVHDVTAAQAAMLAGLLTAPSVYSPTRNLSKALDRANVIIGLMEQQGYLSVSEAHEARAHPAALSSGSAAKAGSYFADWVMDTVPDFLTRNTVEDLVLTTTYDPRIQRAADEALEHVFATKVRQGSRAEAAIVVMSASGEVLAMTGGRNPRATGQFNRATQALRQTGSAFKPIIYAAALESGVKTTDMVEDQPVSFRIPGSGIWRPKNYRDEYSGRITIADAFAKSSNVIAALLSEQVGRRQVRDLARKFGIENALSDGPALALGASESTLLEMTGVYAGILNGGIRATPHGLIDIRLRGESDALIGTPEGTRVQAVSRETAAQLTGLMRYAVDHGTAVRAALDDRPVAGKTGTTQGARDAWFIGFSADYVAGVWMGYDDNTPLTGVTGGGLPAEIWRVAMQKIHDGIAPKPLPEIETRFGSADADTDTIGSLISGLIQ